MNTQLKNPNIEYDFHRRILNEREEFDKGAYEWRQKAIEQFETVYPLCSCYLNSHLHDSGVLSTKYQKGKLLEIRFNDISYQDFCSALVKHQNIKGSVKKWKFPVTWRFQNIKRFSIFRDNKNNRFLPLEVEKYLPKIDSFLYDELQEIAVDKIHIGIAFSSSVCWKYRDESGRCIYHAGLFFDIEAEHLIIELGQDSVIQSLFGAKYLELLKLFQKETQKGICFDYNVAWNFIEKNKELIK